MVCNKCNTPIPDDSDFCQYCESSSEAVKPGKQRRRLIIPILSTVLFVVAAVVFFALAIQTHKHKQLRKKMELGL